MALSQYVLLLQISVQASDPSQLPTWTPKVPESLEPRLMPPTVEHEIEILAAIQNLSNTVIANAASRTLTKLKAKSESKSAFQSPEMLYRALHIISTQRYRFPVRRYIMDLFNVELNPQLSASLDTAAQKLKVSPSQRLPKVDTLRLSVFGRMAPRRETESDESDGDDDIDSPQARTAVPKKDDQPPISLEPRRRIVGFAS
jgi:rapamycin-insensitive companion of mTOR